MKKNILLFTLIAGMGYVVLQGNASGPALNSGGNRTGAKGSVANCSSGGCHTGTAAPTAFIYIDSAGVPVTKYSPGKTYNIRVVGKHATLTKFGFQFAAVSGTDGSTSQIQAGTFASMPTDVLPHTPSGGPTIIEHTTPLSAISPADSFVKAFTWTSPATGVGDITLYLTVNAVNGNLNTDATDASFNVKKVLALNTVPSAVANVSNTINLSAFPNPMTNTLNVQVGNAFGSYSIQAFDITGRNVSSTNIEANATGTATINTSDWATGLYNVVVTSEGTREVIQVVKQ